MEVEEILEETIMLPTEIKQKINSYKSDLENIKTEIKKLQDLCKHEDFEIKSISESVINLRKFCKTCGCRMGYPTRKELIDDGYSI